MSESTQNIEEVVESFLAQRRAGANIDARTFAALHPQLAPELLDALRSIEALEGARAQIDDGFAPVVPSRIGTYRIEREIGRGGMGVVLEAVDESLGRRVALKLLPPELLTNSAARTRFGREAVLASRLDHPGVCTVYGAGISDGQPWIAMRLVEGTTLAQRIRVAREKGAAVVELPGASSVDAPRAIASCIARIARALEYAHSQGVLHRDVKPSNLLVDASGQPILLDFGLAIEPESDASAITRTGDTAGTPAYLAPELISGERARPDERCDVYSLGVTLYECLTLVTPFSGPTREALFRSILAGAALDVRHLNRNVPRDLAVIVATALEHDPARRYASARLLACDLEAFVDGLPIAARPVGWWGRIARWTKREPKQALLAGTLSIAAFALTLVAGILLASREDVLAGRDAQRTNTIDATLFEAFLDLGEKRAERADARFVEVLALDPENADAKVGRVLALLRMRRNEQALELLRDEPRSRVFERLRALAADQAPPLEDSGWIARASAFELFVDGECLRVEGDLRPPIEREEWMRVALSRFDEAVVRAPQPRAYYHVMRAWTALACEDERSARSASAALVALWPDSTRILYYAGTTLASFDPRAGLELLERASKLNPDHAPTLRSIGTAYCLLGEFEQALDPLQRSLEIDPADFDTHNTLGCALKCLGCDDDARASFLAALSLNPYAIKVWANLFNVALDNRGRLQSCEHVLDLDPAQTAFRAVYGEMLIELGEHTRACEQFAICVAELPDEAPYWIQYASLLNDIGEPHTALDAAAIARSMSPADARLDEIEERAQLAIGLEE